MAFLASVCAAALLGLDARSALFLGWRDRRKHESPNAAWLEASFAGALGLGLGGPAWYGGLRLEKPALGEARRPPEAADIKRSVLLMYSTAILFAAMCAALCGLLRGGAGPAFPPLALDGSRLGPQVLGLVPEGGQEVLIEAEGAGLAAIEISVGFAEELAEVPRARGVCAEGDGIGNLEGLAPRG